MLQTFFRVLNIGGHRNVNYLFQQSCNYGYRIMYIFMIRVINCITAIS